VQTQAQESGKRGANLGDVLARHNGAKYLLRIRREAGYVEFSILEAGDNGIRRVPIYQDKLSGMESFFTALPL